jgi:hypothetical protein
VNLTASVPGDTQKVSQVPKVSGREGKDKVDESQLSGSPASLGDGVCMEEYHNYIDHSVDKIDENIQPGPGAPNTMPVDESRKCEVPRDQNGAGLDPANHSGSGLDEEKS